MNEMTRLLIVGFLLLLVPSARAGTTHCSDAIAVYSAIILDYPHGQDWGIRHLLCLPLATTIETDTRGAPSLEELYAAEQQITLFPGIGAINSSTEQARRALARLPKIKAGTKITVLGVYYSPFGEKDIRRVHSIPPDPHDPNPLNGDKLREMALIKLPTGAKLYTSVVFLTAVHLALMNHSGGVVRIGPSERRNGK
jgi:hypothetical protein